MNLQIFHFKILDSTQTYAKKIIETSHTIQNALVLADTQIDGRGRLNNRVWVSKVGNFHGSFIINLSDLLPESKISLLNPLIMQAIINTLSKILKNVKVKLPNDIYVNNKKIAGVLIEAFYPYAIIGIGINLIESPLSTSTSIYAECNRRILNTDDCFINILFSNIINLLIKVKV